MIELLEGVPGSGKTHHLIKDRFLPWVKSGRRIYIYCRGIYTDRLSVFLGVPEEDLKKQLTIWAWGDEAPVLNMFETVEPESVVIVDEAQTIFRSQTKLDARLTRWLETHRHYGVDVLFTCQDYRQITSPVTRLVEVTIKFWRLSFFGLGNRFQGRVRGNPEETEVIRKFTGTYDPKVFGFYESYAGKTLKEDRVDRHNVFLTPKMLVAGVAAVFAAVVFYVQPFSSIAMPKDPDQVRDAHGNVIIPQPKKNSALAPQKDLAPIVSETVQAPPMIVVQGGLSPLNERGHWVYLLASGEFMTAAEIASTFGIQVQEVQVGKVKKLKGKGIKYDDGSSASRGSGG